MAASYSSSSINVGVSTDELTCTICLELLTEPVTLPCGHSFCNLCVEKCWKSREEVGECFCPNCREVFPQKPKLKKNVMLAGLVEQVRVQVKMKQEEVESRIDVNDSGSHCEVCNRQAAKLCLPCEILCCEKHVKPHEQKGHKLVEPVKYLGELRCPDHKRSIQLHCFDDGKLMCPMCMDGQHQDHKVVAVEIAHNELKGILTAKCPEVSKSKQHVQSQLHQLENEVKDTQHVGQGTEDRLEAKRRMLYQYVDEAVDLLKSRVHKVQERKLFLLEKQIEKLQQQMEYLCKAESSLQTSLQTSLQELEVISFLGGFKDLVKRIEVGLHFQSMKVTPSKLLDFSPEEKDLDSLINNNKKFVDRITKEPVEHPEMDEFELSTLRSIYFRSPSLDRNSGHPRIVISEDLKTVTLSQTTNLCPAYPDGFDSHPQVLSSESFSSDRHFWEVNVGSCRQCRIGVALNSMGRKGKESRLGENPESWCVEKNKNGYLAWHNNQCTSLQGNPNQLGFFLNCEEGELRCFGDSRVLHVFKGNFKEAVKPALGIDDFEEVNYGYGYGYGYVSAVVDSVWFCLF